MVKAAPLYHALKQRGNRPQLLYTGQHSDHAMLGSFAEVLGLPPGLQLTSAPSANLRLDYISQLSALIQSQMQQLRPDLVCVFGDVNSSLAGAQAARNLSIKIAHIESGLRSGDMAMPEELNRIAIDQLADLLFTTETAGTQNLLKEGRAALQIHQCGNTMIDALKENLPKAKKEKLAIKQPYIWLSLHRPANVDTEATLLRSLNWVRALTRVLPVFLPIHPRFQNNLTKFGLFDKLVAIPQLTLSEPLPYLSNLAHMAAASLIVTDSGGVQEEAVGLEKSCITLRTTTERPSTIDCGSNTLMPEPEPTALMAAVQQLLAREQTIAFTSPFGWDGTAAQRIADILVKYN
jgi:UDP-N-acetylglucosamine 2-epimerase (non-hydrolysing)